MGGGRSFLRWGHHKKFLITDFVNIMKKFKSKIIPRKYFGVAYLFFWSYIVFKQIMSEYINKHFRCVHIDT